MRIKPYTIVELDCNKDHGNNDYGLKLIFNEKEPSPNNNRYGKNLRLVTFLRSNGTLDSYFYNPENLLEKHRSIRAIEEL